MWGGLGGAPKARPAFEQHPADQNAAIIVGALLRKPKL
jgi:hypothetical protein